jgi:hypothetical protein
VGPVHIIYGSMDGDLAPNATAGSDGQG